MRLSLLLLALALLAPDAHAQRRGSFGIGGQVGDPSGLTLKLGTGPAFDLAAGWDLSGPDRLFVQGHLLLAERALTGSPVGYFYGPGAFLATRERPGGDDVVAAGLSFNVGLNYYTGPVELFGQLTPRLRLVDETDFDFGGAVGLRFYP